MRGNFGERGVSVVRRERQGDPAWPATHHIWILADSRDAAFEQFESLTAAGIHTNYRKLPYRLGYGLRLGTSFSAVAGVDVPHLEELADIIAAAITGGASDALRTRVRALADDARANAILPPEHWT